MFVVAFLLLTALTFALLAYDTDRTGRHTVAALLAGGAWLFACRNWRADLRADLDLAVTPRRFPPPWSAEETDACFTVRDHGVHALAYVYFADLGHDV
jgi:hypothetical protein